jgi:hypothetical protein
MKKLFVFAMFYLAFTGFAFSDKQATPLSDNNSISALTAQQAFGYFRIHRQAKNVVLNWSVTSPAGVTGFVVERSYDGEFFDVINEMPCNNATKFSWKDMSVFPGVIYYRIGYISETARVTYSDVEVIRIVQRG